MNTTYVPKSDHPNPWRPQTEVERFVSHYDRYRIYRGTATHFAPKPSMLEELSPLRRVTVNFGKGAALGAFYGMFDALYVSGIKSPKAQLARALYFAGPLGAAGASIPACKEVLKSVSLSMGGDPDALWTYGATALAPASIIGFFSGRPLVVGYPLFVLAAATLMAHKFLSDVGLLDPELYIKSSQTETSMWWPYEKKRLGQPARHMRTYGEGEPQWAPYVDQED